MVINERYLGGMVDESGFHPIPIETDYGSAYPLEIAAMITVSNICSARTLLKIEQDSGRLTFPDSFVLNALCDMMERETSSVFYGKEFDREYSSQAGSGPGQADPTGPASPTRSRHARSARRFGRGRAES